MNDSINTRTKNASKDNQMKSKLDAMGLFEEGMSRQEMENLLKALDSSKNDTMSQGTADDVSPPSVETDLMIRQSSVEYDDQTPPINHRAFHTKNQDVKSQKLNTPLSIVDSDEEIFERNDDNNITNNIINRQSSTPTYANMLQQKNMNNRTMKIFSKIDNINNDLRCMDPLDHEETHDKPLLPLRTKNPPADSRKIMVINKKPIIPTDELESIKKHIDDVINQWQKWELETSDEVEFRWGAPIQVCTSNQTINYQTNY